MTAALVVAANEYNALGSSEQQKATLHPSEPPLENPMIGNPISHGQILDIAKALKNSRATRDASGNEESSQTSCNLDNLLRGCHIYIPPSPPKPEPVSRLFSLSFLTPSRLISIQTQAYKDLMARLRAASEAQQYATFSSSNTSTNPFSISTRNSLLLSQPTHDPFAKPEDDDITFADVNRQLTLIINVLVSIIACGIAIWLVAGHIAAPKRLALAMVGALVVAVAEVAIYAGYLRKLGEAKEKERGKKERKVISKTWTIGASLSDKNANIVGGKEKGEDVDGMGVRFRTGKRR